MSSFKTTLIIGKVQKYRKVSWGKIHVRTKRAIFVRICTINIQMYIKHLKSPDHLKTTCTKYDVILKNIFCLKYWRNKGIKLNTLGHFLYKLIFILKSEYRISLFTLIHWFNQFAINWDGSESEGDCTKCKYKYKYK